MPSYKMANRGFSPKVPQGTQFVLLCIVVYHWSRMAQPISLGFKMCSRICLNREGHYQGLAKERNLPPLLKAGIHATWCKWGPDLLCYLCQSLVGQSLHPQGSITPFHTLSRGYDLLRAASDEKTVSPGLKTIPCLKTHPSSRSVSGHTRSISTSPDIPLNYISFFYYGLVACKYSCACMHACVRARTRTRIFLELESHLVQSVLELAM